jgi:hypothetical protein
MAMAAEIAISAVAAFEKGTDLFSAYTIESMGVRKRK